jgi:hypothetical protein
MVRGAEEAQPDVPLAGKPLHHGLGEARLANARLARHEYDLALPRFRLVPAPHEQRHLLVAADERRCCRAQRLEPALHHARAHHLVRVHAIGEALCLDAAEIAVLKQTAHQTAGGCIDDDGARRRRGLQTSSEIRRLANNSLLLSCARSNEIADYNQPGANANADLERFNAAQFANRFDKCQSASDRALGVVLMRLRITEIDQHAVAHVFRHEAVEAGDRLGDTFVISADHSP